MRELMRTRGVAGMEMHFFGAEVLRTGEMNLQKSEGGEDEGSEEREGNALSRCMKP